MLFYNCFEQDRGGHLPKFSLPSLSNKYERVETMNKNTLENFKKLSPEKQDKLIALIEKLLKDYRLLFFARH